MSRSAVLGAWWRTLQVREQWALALGGTVVALYVLWALALQPALRVLSTAPAKLERLDAELAAMQALAGEARLGSAQAPLTAAQSGAALQASTARLGNRARVNLQGDRAVVMLEPIARADLRQLLAEARAGARARTVEAKLQFGPEGVSGTLVLALGGTP